MQSREPRRATISFFSDVAIALGLVASFVYFIVIVEYHIGAGELTHGQLLLLGGKIRTTHSTAPSGNNKHN